MGETRELKKSALALLLIDAMDNLTIAMVLPRVVEGGIRTHLREIIPELRVRGHKVVLITSTRYEALSEVTTERLYNFHTFPLPFYGLSPWSLPHLLNAIEKCDVVHAHAYPHFLADYLTITRNRYQKPLVLTFHGSFHQYASRKALYLKKVHNMFMLGFANMVDKFIAVSKAEKNEVIKRGIPENNVEIVYNGISTSYVNFPRPPQPESVEKKILYLGRLAGSKNPELLVEAMPHVLNKIANVKLIFAGADYGKLRVLERLALQFGTCNAVEFVGEISEEQKLKYLSSCDVFVHPSLQDIFSLSILEASAAGLPVVAFDTGSNSEMILHGQTGLVVKPHTSIALAEAIVKILAEPGLAKTMGEKAREYTLKTFSWESTVDGLENIYKSVVQPEKQILRATPERL